MPRKPKSPRKSLKTIEAAALELNQKRVFSLNNVQGRAGPNSSKGLTSGGRPPMFPGRQGGR